MSKKVLILTDGKAGHENQSKAFARSLGCEADVVEVHFKSKLHKTISYLLDKLGVRTMKLLDVSATEEQWRYVLEGRHFDAVIGTGSGTFYAAKSLAKTLKVKCGVVLYPRGYDIGSFDCILAPAFDRPKKAANVVEIPANLVAADAEFYEKGVKAYYEKTSVTPDIAVIIGGPNKCSTMSPAWMKDELDKIFTLPGKKAVTTSRRTPAEAEALVDSYPWDYRLLYSREKFNPIPAFVKLAKKLYVTAESTGMLSEACTFGTAEVYALDNLNPGPHKFRRFVEDLTKAGYVGGSRKVDLTNEFKRAKELMAL